MRRNTMATLIALSGCLNSDAQLSSTIGDTLMDTTAEPPGENCPEGGILLSLGPDENRDGLLEADEVTQREYICNGYNPGVPLAEQTDEPPGDNCAYGGTRLDIGNDVDQDGVLDPEEISETIYLCDDAPTGGGFKVPQAVVVGLYRTCAIREGGEPVCWDANDFVPPIPGELTALDILNQTDTCGLRPDGSLDCWSYRTTWDWPWVVPTGTFTAWDGHCGLRDDGTVACLDGFGLDGTFTAMSSNACGIVPYEGAQCPWFVCGVRTDGAVVCADESAAPSRALIPPTGAFKQVSVSATLQNSDTSASPFACGIRTDDTLACWGNPTYIGVMPVPSGTFRSVSAGWSHACAIRTDGTVACWGAAPLTGPSFPFSQAPEGVFRQVSSGRQRSCGVRDDGHLLCWGKCSEGECVTPPEVYH
jgi:hypothetical protein